MAYKSLKKIKNIMMGALVTAMAVAFLPAGAGYSQTVVIPDCPSVDDLPKKGIMDKPEGKKKQPNAQGEVKPEKQKNS